MFQIITTSYFKLLSKVILSDNEWHSKIAEIYSIHLFEDENELIFYLTEQFELNIEEINKINKGLSSSIKLFIINKIPPLYGFELNLPCLNIIESEGKILFWKDWFCIARLVNDDIFLWSHRNAFADYTIEIKLSDKEKKKYINSGNAYLIDLSVSLLSDHSAARNEAIKENRVIKIH